MRSSSARPEKDQASGPAQPRPGAGHGRCGSQRDQVLVDVGADPKLHAVVRHDVDGKLEERLELLPKPPEREQSGVLGQVDEQVEVGVGPSSPRATLPNTRRSLMPCFAASASTAARRRRSRCPIARIEAGRVDPGWSTLRKVLAAAGEEAVLTTRRLPATPARPPAKTTLAGLSDAWKRTARGDTPDWSQLRGALDVLAQHPELLPGALRRDRSRRVQP